MGIGGIWVTKEIEDTSRIIGRCSAPTSVVSEILRQFLSAWLVDSCMNTALTLLPASYHIESLESNFVQHNQPSKLLIIFWGYVKLDQPIYHTQSN